MLIVLTFQIHFKSIKNYKKVFCDMRPIYNKQACMPTFLILEYRISKFLGFEREREKEEKMGKGEGEKERMGREGNIMRRA
jgi:hypothetical protein